MDALFGARYYDPKVVTWLSTDPALGDYLPTGKQVYFPEKAFNAMSLKGAGGIYNSININLFHYASLNPLRFIDPDGNATMEQKDEAAKKVWIIAAGTMVVTAGPDPSDIVVAIGAGIITGLIYLGVDSVTKAITEDDTGNDAEVEETKKTKTDKSGKHKNQDAKKKAEEDYKREKDVLQEMRTKRNKTKQDNKDIKKQERTVDHLKKKMDEVGETHWRKGSSGDR